MMTQRERLASGYLYTDMDEGCRKSGRGEKCWRMNLTIRPRRTETRGVDPPDDGAASASGITYGLSHRSHVYLRRTKSSIGDNFCKINLVVVRRWQSDYRQ